MNTVLDIPADPAEAIRSDHLEAIQRACRRIAPLWGLDELVAVNPYLGVADEPVPAADARLRRCLGDGVLPTPASLATAWRAGRFDADDLERARLLLGLEPDRVEPVLAHLSGTGVHLRHRGPQVQSVARRYAAHGLEPWPATIAGVLGAFLAGRSEGGIARFPALAESDVWHDWLRYAALDRTLAAHGLAGFHHWVASLPPRREEACARLLADLAVPTGSIEDYVLHLLGSMQGWAGALRRAGWAGSDLDQVADLAAILLACEAGLARLHPRAPQHLRHPVVPAGSGSSPAEDLLPLLAAELGFRRRVLAPLAANAAPTPPPRRPAAHAVFCIDVRSEPMRRALENADPGIVTAGFAGFFGIAAEVADDEGRRAQCPVLLTPGHRVGLVPPRPQRWFGRLLGHMRRAAGGGFAYMETAGFLSALPLVRETLGLRLAPADGDADALRNPEH